jgi:hypothetical protein
MAMIDGEWESVAQSPMGEQRSTLTLTSDANGGFSGTSSGAAGTSQVTDGKVDGDQVTFKLNMTSPFPMTLTATGTLNGDAFDGTIDTGAFGKFPMKATRKS